MSKKLLNFAGICLVALCFYYVGVSIWKNWKEINATELSYIQILGLVILSILYASLLSLIAKSWHLILQILTSKPLDQKLVTKTYARTQIAKYLPGNVFHLVGRVYYAKTIGSDKKQVTYSLLIESFGLVLASMLIAIPAIFLGISDHSWLALGSSSVTLLFITIVVAILSLYFFYTRKQELACPNLIQWLVPLRHYCLFFLLSSMIFVAVSNLIELQMTLKEVIFIASMYSLSWCIGYLIPGASAGLGIRESALIWSLSSVAPVHLAVVCALLMRLVTTAGDVWYFSFHKIFKG